MMTPIRILVADDHTLVREGIRAILANETDMEVVAFASDGLDAVEQSAVHHPDVVVMDISMPVMDGIHASERILHNQYGTTTQIVILSMHVNLTLVRQALRMGAHGYVSKSRATDELPQAIRAAFEGDVYLSSDIPQSYLHGL